MLALLAGPPRPARAVLDVDDQGPTLKAGAFELRVTNAGILGNAFPERSFDPSFEFPIGSGQELMRDAALWVGATTDQGPHVSGGPLLEWRPSPGPEDRVRTAWHGREGAAKNVDDDGDGRVDEEVLDGRDDDGDGEVDEDLGMASQQMLTADYADDRPEAVHFVYPNGERHVPLGLSVHQEVYGWSTPGYDGIAGLDFKITNHGGGVLEGVYAGLLVDLDSRGADDPSGHANDRVEWRHAFRDIDLGLRPRITVLRRTDPDTVDTFSCIRRMEATFPVLRDGRSPLPASAVIGLDHTTDALELVGLRAGFGPGFGSAPGRPNFTYTVFANGRPPGAGGPPITDDERYAALSGALPGAAQELAEDYVVLVSCGPFRIAPGQSISFRAALLAGADADTLPAVAANALQAHYGTWLNLESDTTGFWTSEWTVGRSGLNGHEACVTARPGERFFYEPDCIDAINPDGPRIYVFYTPDRCVWTDADCDKCTGFGGNETLARWSDPGELPPAPSMRVVPGDHENRIAWDNVPEILVDARVAGPKQGEFVGYAVYRMADWRNRRSPLPPRETFALVGAFGRDANGGQVPLAAVTDSSLDYLDLVHERRRYPVGHYAIRDTSVLNGFDYVYVVATIVEVSRVVVNVLVTRRYESPLVASFTDAIRPRAEARGQAGGVWVVPNPFRARAGWDRRPVYGDRITRHLDFMGLPRARCRIRIWTVAGDLVREIDHDGSDGSGQAAWDLVTRNGQEAESGIYLFTVESPLGRDQGRFVVVR